MAAASAASFAASTAAVAVTLAAAVGSGKTHSNWRMQMPKTRKIDEPVITKTTSKMIADMRAAPVMHRPVTQRIVHNKCLSSLLLFDLSLSVPPVLEYCKAPFLSPSYYTNG